MNVIAARHEQLGYKWAYRVVDSRAFGLPQRRRRVYLLASLEGDPRHVLFADEAGVTPEPVLNGHPAACGFYWTEGLRGLGWAVDAIPTLKGGSTIGIPSPPAIWLPDGRLVTPDIRDGERFQGFPAGWTKAAEAVAKKGARWKLVGNAVSVPAATWIGRRMHKPGRLLELDVQPMRGHRNWPGAAWNVGEGRFVVGASEWPKRQAIPPLTKFLSHKPSLLSARATSGFLSRTRKANLRFLPEFIRAVERHLDAVSS
jgi:DNA (cytosine-5)-methyltransferase 1